MIIFPPQGNQAIDGYNRKYYINFTHVEWLESNVQVPAIIIRGQFNELYIEIW